MNDHEPLDELPEALQDALRGLGGVRAPAELRDRVELARLPRVEAPAELWARVAPEVARLARERTAQPQGGRLLQFPKVRRAAAAAVLVAGVGITLMLQDAPERGPDLAVRIPEEQRAEFRSRLIVEEVEEHQMSSTGRVFVAMCGGEIES